MLLLLSRERRRRKRREEGLERNRGRGFMTARFQLSFESTGALLKKLCWITISSAVLLLAIYKQISLCSANQQGTSLLFPTVSMRLRPKRTCSGVECFGGFHIKRFLYLFLFFRGPHT